MKEKVYPVCVEKSFHFDAAHYLPGYKGPCGNLHGHTWTLTVSVLGNYYKKEDKMFLDFKDLSRIVKSRVLDLFDHKMLNEVISKDVYPSAENLSIFIGERLIPQLKKVIEGSFALDVALKEGEGGTAHACFTV